MTVVLSVTLGHTIALSELGLPNKMTTLWKEKKNLFAHQVTGTGWYVSKYTFLLMKTLGPGRGRQEPRGLAKP